MRERQRETETQRERERETDRQTERMANGGSDERTGYDVTKCSRTMRELVIDCNPFTANETA